MVISCAFNIIVLVVVNLLPCKSW